MRFEILTLFPQTFEGFLKASLIGKAAAKGLLDIHVHDLRDFAPNRRQADDRPYGGGPGMVLMAEPVYQALGWVKKNCLKPLRLKPSHTSTLALSAKGKPFNQKQAQALSSKKAVILLAGHYEGVDERALKFFKHELSIGPYVTMGGEAPAMVMIEAVSRLIPGVIGNPESLQNESFALSQTFQEWPQYTRPAVWRGKQVPKVLLSGHHSAIRSWREKQRRTIRAK